MSQEIQYQIVEDYIQAHREAIRQEAMRWWQIGIRLNPSVFPELYEAGFYDNPPSGDTENKNTLRDITP